MAVHVVGGTDVLLVRPDEGRGNVVPRSSLPTWSWPWIVLDPMCSYGLDSRGASSYGALSALTKVPATKSPAAAYPHSHWPM